VEKNYQGLIESLYSEPKGGAHDSVG